MSRIAATGAIWSVLMSSDRSGTAMPVWVVNGCINAFLKLSHVGDAARDRGRCCGCRTDEVRPHLRPLAVLEIAIGGGDDTLAGLAAVAVAPGAHRTARL